MSTTAALSRLAKKYEGFYTPNGQESPKSPRPVMSNSSVSKREIFRVPKLVEVSKNTESSGITQPLGTGSMAQWLTERETNGAPFFSQKLSEQEFQDAYCRAYGRPIETQRHEGADYIYEGIEYEFVLGNRCEIKDILLYPQEAEKSGHTYVLVFQKPPLWWITAELKAKKIKYEVFYYEKALNF